MKFEEKMHRLEELVAKMEAGGLGLEDAIAAFEEGRKLIEACGTELDSIRQRIEKVTKDGTTEELNVI